MKAETRKLNDDEIHGFYPTGFKWPGHLKSKGKQEMHAMFELQKSR
jgi:hypothetical protein